MNQHVLAPDAVVVQLRKMKQPVTRENYAVLAYWKPHRKLNAEERVDVREAVYEANIHQDGFLHSSDF